MAVIDATQWGKEQSEVFDVLYNNTGSNQAPELDDYEKSLYLTKAQDEIVKNHFTAVSNPKGQGFDDSLKRQSEFAPLLKTINLTALTEEEDASTLANIQKIDQRSIIYIFPDDYFISVNEELYESVTSKEQNTNDPGSSPVNAPIPTTPATVLYQYVVNPIQYGEYKRQMLKPYQYPVKKTAWRIFNGAYTINIGNEEKIRLVAEIIGRFQTSSPPKYQLRYVRQPKPIILTNLNDGQFKGQGLSIKGETQPTMCELGTDAFNEVMQRAVELAKNAWEGNIETTKAFGERSE